MGYSIKIKSQNPITENDIDNFISQLDKKYNPYTEYFTNIKNDNRYSLCCDLTIIDSNNINISGSYGISGDIVEDFIKEFKKYFNDKKLNFQYFY